MERLTSAHNHEDIHEPPSPQVAESMRGLPLNFLLAEAQGVNARTVGAALLKVENMLKENGANGVVAGEDMVEAARHYPDILRKVFSSGYNYHFRTRDQGHSISITISGEQIEFCFNNATSSWEPTDVVVVAPKDGD